MVFRRIEQNPFRVLGVFSNAKANKLLSNYRKLKSFASVGKSAPLDDDTCLADYLRVVDRSVESLEAANAGLQLDKEKIGHALFWFIDASPVDNVAFNNLKVGNREKAFETWRKQDTFSTRVNRATAYLLVSGQARRAVTMMASVLNDETKRRDFVSAVCGEQAVFSAEELMLTYMKGLADSVEASQLLQWGRELGLPEASISFLSGMAISDSKNQLEDAIRKAENAADGSANEALKAGEQLAKVASTTLSKIKEAIGEANPQYKRIADEVARAIRNCAIVHYNESRQDDVAVIDRTIGLTKHAMKYAVGSVAKTTLKEDLKMLKERKENAMYAKDLSDLFHLKKNFEAGSDSIDRARNFVGQCKPIITRLKTTLRPVEPDLFLKVSSAIASVASSMVVRVLNNMNTPRLTTIREALAAFDEIGALDMLPQTKAAFNTNKAGIKELETKVVISTTRLIPELSEYMKAREEEERIRKLLEKQYEEQNMNKKGCFDRAFERPGVVIFWIVVIFIILYAMSH